MQNDIFDGNIKIAAIVDDGHGMNRAEFESKWLIVGTESKTNGIYKKSHIITEPGLHSNKAKSKRVYSTKIIQKAWLSPQT